MTDFQKGLILLIKSALNEEHQEVPQNFDFKKALEVAKKHQISIMLYYGAVNSGVAENSPELQELFNSVCVAIAITSRQTFRIKTIFSAFEKNGIDYMPLKGINLKSIYPKPEMRTMSDADILITEKDYNEKVKGIVEEMGYTEVEETDHELKWKISGLFLELHKRIIPSYNKDFYRYFGDGWRLAKNQDGHRFYMNNEDEYIYLFTHLAKHYRNGGIGIKHFTDLWVYKKKYPNMDFEYIYRELEKLDLLEFFKNTEQVIAVWFEGKEPTEKTDFMTDYVFASGAYGTNDSRSAAELVMDKHTNDESLKTTSARRIFNMFFLPYKGMCIKYPILIKKPILMPIYWFVRWFEIIFVNKRTVSEIGNAVNNASTKNIQSFSDSLEYVGLKFNFKE